MNVSRTSALDLVQWIQGRNALNEFNRWMADPTTQRVIDGLFLLSQPRQVHRSRVTDAIDPFDAVQASAFSHGRCSMLEFVTRLAEMHEGEEAGDEANSAVMRHLVDVERMSEADARKLIADEASTGE